MIMLSVSFNVKVETYLVQVISLLVCLEPLEGMLHLSLSPQPIRMGPSLSAMFINQLWMCVWLAKEMNSRKGTTISKLIPLVP